MTAAAGQLSGKEDESTDEKNSDVRRRASLSFSSVSAVDHAKDGQKT
jgi:hypothetical protein